MAPRLSAQDKQWQREDDARTLARAEEIRLSPVRLKGAVKEAKVIAKRTEKQTLVMKAVANKSGLKTVVRSNKQTPLTRARATKKRK